MQSTLLRYQSEILAALRHAVQQASEASALPGEAGLISYYGQMQYHLGWVDAHFSATTSNPGKLLRPTLLLLAESYARRVDELLTLFLSLKTDDLVGFQVKGVRKNLRRLGDFGLAIKHGKVRCGLFFHLLAFLAEKPEQQKSYLDLGRRTKDVDIELDELVGV